MCSLTRYYRVSADWRCIEITVEVTCCIIPSTGELRAIETQTIIPRPADTRLQLVAGLFSKLCSPFSPFSLVLRPLSLINPNQHPPSIRPWCLVSPKACVSVRRRRPLFLRLLLPQLGTGDLLLTYDACGLATVSACEENSRSVCLLD